MSYNLFETPIEFLKGVGPLRADILKKELQIFTFGDLLTFYPFRYLDRSRFFQTDELNTNMPFVQLKGYIKDIQFHGGKRITRMTANFYDEHGKIELVWFAGIKWLKDKFRPNIEYIIFGKPTVFNGKFNITHPELQAVAEQNLTTNSSLQAFYNSTEKLKTRGLDSKGISSIMRNLMIQVAGFIEETLPDGLVLDLKLMKRSQAIINIHFPKSFPILAEAQNRIKFEELFFLQLKLLKLKLIRTEKSKGFIFGSVGKHFNDFFFNCLHFELTNAQKKVIKEIRTDLGSGKQMNRLLQGDVGSGKTLVALMLMLLGIDNSYQACIMAPTEILAIQHFENIKKLLKGLDIKVCLLTGSTKTKERKIIHEELLNGQINILIGTHALLEDIVQFQNLGIVIIDEQHRFGVAQRAKLWAKNDQPPHILVMTATPIPRTLAMTCYGDLEISVIDELPPGRKAIKTFHYFESKRLLVFGFMKEQIKQGRQIYVVYPLINESEKLDLMNLMQGYESIVRVFPLPEYAVSIVHGKMKAADKDYEMQRFVKGETQIMVATTVIEVGVDVPNASVMIIENSERFGLSQLHQLRGRVGRGADQSFCILMTGNKISSDGKKRIETMVRTTDGFEIAEQDLKLRGPGDIEGTQQSGITDLKLSDIIKDEKILLLARKTAIEVLNDDPQLENPKNIRIVNELKNLNKHNTNWSKIS
ncbi:MAG: ATP-dependent DNA helicase RecG [Bacteroidetes bacterium]|nr:ATP-dependent DNA helicase RecG [Bacteroidota bacterium]